MKIILEDYEKLFNFNASKKLKSFYDKLNLEYEETTQQEKELIFE